MINIFFSCILVSFIIIVYGDFFCKKILISKEKENIYEKGIIGTILLSFFGLILNFIIPLNIIVNNTIIILAFIYYLFFLNYQKKIFFKILLISSLSSILIILNNVNRPDAGLYHLPFINILNENKIIIGLSNLHFRFGHISIIQYLSAIFRNSFLSDNGIIIPPAIIISLFLLFLLDKIINILKKKNCDLIFYLFLLLLLIFCLYTFSNYSKYGNDAPSYVYFFYLLILTLSVYKIKSITLHALSKIYIVSIFVILNKIFFILVIIIPLFFFYCKKKIFIKFNKSLIFGSLFIVAWIIKNFLVSGCLVYPLSQSCIKEISWINNSDIILQQLSGEAWAKSWPDFINQGAIANTAITVSMEEFIKNFNWINSWNLKHRQVIIEKLSPFIIFTLFLLPVIFLSKKNGLFLKKNRNNFNIIIFITLINFFGSVLWFFKFPLYRYGIPYIITFTSGLFILSIYISSKKKIFLNITIQKLIIYSSLTLFIFVNLIRIKNNYYFQYNNYPWPKIYSFSDSNKKIDPKVITKDGKILYYLNNSECMYGYAPCTNIIDSKIEIIYKEHLTYKFFTIKNK